MNRSKIIAAASALHLLFLGPVLVLGSESPLQNKASSSSSCILALHALALQMKAAQKARLEFAQSFLSRFRPEESGFLLRQLERFGLDLSKVRPLGFGAHAVVFSSQEAEFKDQVIRVYRPVVMSSGNQQGLLLPDETLKVFRHLNERSDLRVEGGFKFATYQPTEVDGVQLVSFQRGKRLDELLRDESLPKDMREVVLALYRERTIQLVDALRAQRHSKVRVRGVGLLKQIFLEETVVPLLIQFEDQGSADVFKIFLKPDSVMIDLDDMSMTIFDFI